MRTGSWCTLAALAMMAAGCAGGAEAPHVPTTTGDDSATPSATLGGRDLRSDVATSALALYTINVDPATLTATSHLKEHRSAQQTDDLYELSIGAFMTPSTLSIASVSRGTGTLDIAYAVTHPFKAPADLDGAPTAANRADLGIAGRVLFLIDSMDPSSDTYFQNGSDRVIADTALVTNADGYYTPADLLSISGFAANTFPYKVLVNETLDPRISTASLAPIPNGGVTGNYDPATGWQRSNIGTGNDGWTGYGIMHQGQTVGNVLHLDSALLQAGASFSFDAAIIAKYEDPRGGANGVEKKSNRLPRAAADLTQFVYREPHGALDVESVAFGGEGGGFIPNQVSGSELTFKVVDWDARATESAEGDLHNEVSNASAVAIGESGAPSLSVCIPGVLGDATTAINLSGAALIDDDSAFGGDAGQDSGQPGDPLTYSEIVTKLVVSGQVDGTYSGMVRAIDVEDNLASPLVTPLDEGLTPLSGNRPRPISYQAFDVVMALDNDAPTLSLFTPANVTSGTTTSLTVNAAGDGDGEDIDIEIDWDNDGIFEDTQTIVSPYTTPIVYNSTIPAYNNSTLNPVTRTIPVRYTDGVGATIVYTPALQFTLGANRPPQITGQPELQDPTLISPATFSLNVGTATFTDPEGNPITLKVTNSVNATIATSATFPIAGLGPFTNPSTPTVDFTAYATDALHPDTGAGPSNGSAFPVRTGTVQVPCTPNVPIINAQFTSGADGFVQGHVFVPVVNNSDASLGNSRFYRCTAHSSQTAGGGFSGGCWTTGPGALFGCGLGNSDYGNNMDNNSIGPTFSLAGKTDAVLIFNSSKNGRPNVCHYRVWISTDNGVNWSASNIIYDTTQPNNTLLNENNVTVSLQAYCGLPNLRLRFQAADPTTSTYSSPVSGAFAGWGFDNVRVNACP